MARTQARFLWSLPLVAAVTVMMPPPAAAAVTANIVGNQLQVAGDGADDSITLRLVAGNATQVEVLDGAVVRGTFARAAFASILVQGNAGNDTILTYASSSYLAIYAGDGDDCISAVSPSPGVYQCGNGNDQSTGYLGSGCETLAFDCP